MTPHDVPLGSDCDNPGKDREYDVMSPRHRWWPPVPRPLLAAAVVALGVSTLIRAQAPETETLPVRGQVSLVSAGGVNALVQVGPQGVLVVDTMTQPLADPLLAAIRTLAGRRPIRYVVNTHHDPEFTGGNLRVAAAGAQLVAGNFAGQVGQTAVDGIVPQAFVVAHENVLAAMSAPTGSQSPTPFGAWPTDTFFQSEKTLYFNGEGIQLVHVASASTNGDILVFFRSSDVIAAGDIYNTVEYPRIDVGRGGTVNGVIEGLNRLVDLAIPEQFTEGGTRIVPGRGRISDEFDVVEYRDMVTIVRDRVDAMVRKGLSLEQVKAARPTLDWEPRYGSTSGPWTTTQFVEAVYRSLLPVDRRGK
jgi:glyoxylase-like metal-dependent hydrolase (beta-lactamase superfamily II)